MNLQQHPLGSTSSQTTPCTTGRTHNVGKAVDIYACHVDVIDPSPGVHRPLIGLRTTGPVLSTSTRALQASYDATSAWSSTPSTDAKTTVGQNHLTMANNQSIQDVETVDGLRRKPVRGFRPIDHSRIDDSGETQR